MLLCVNFCGGYCSFLVNYSVGLEKAGLRVNRELSQAAKEKDIVSNTKVQFLKKAINRFWLKLHFWNRQTSAIKWYLSFLLSISWPSDEQCSIRKHCQALIPPRRFQSAPAAFPCHTDKELVGSRPVPPRRRDSPGGCYGNESLVRPLGRSTSPQFTGEARAYLMPSGVFRADLVSSLGRQIASGCDRGCGARWHPTVPWGWLSVQCAPFVVRFVSPLTFNGEIVETEARSFQW